MSQQQKSQTVWVGKLWKRSTKGIYHTNKDCRQLQRSESISSKPLNVLREDMRECEICKLSEQSHGVQQDTDCPYCGETVGKLPNHLPKCDQA